MNVHNVTCIGVWTNLAKCNFVRYFFFRKFWTFWTPCIMTRYVFFFLSYQLTNLSFVKDEWVKTWKTPHTCRSWQKRAFKLLIGARGACRYRFFTIKFLTFFCYTRCLFITINMYRTESHDDNNQLLQLLPPTPTPHSKPTPGHHIIGLHRGEV